MSTTPPLTPQTAASATRAVETAKAAQISSVVQKVASTTARAADGDYKTKGAGHMVKDADGDYKPAVTGGPSAPTARPAAATQAALAALVKGG